MKMHIEGDINQEKLLELGRFLVKLFKDTPEKIFVTIEEGTKDMTKKECAKLLADMFAGSKFYQKIFDGFIEADDSEENN